MPRNVIVATVIVNITQIECRYGEKYVCERETKGERVCVCAREREKQRVCVCE